MIPSRDNLVVNPPSDLLALTNATTRPSVYRLNIIHCVVHTREAVKTDELWSISVSKTAIESQCPVTTHEPAGQDVTNAGRSLEARATSPSAGERSEP